MVRRRSSVKKDGHWNVLIVDDSLPDAMKPFQLMMRHGDQVTLCLDGKDALIEYETGPYDLIILDLKMPEVSGLEFLRRLNRRPVTPENPVRVVLYSGSEVDLTVFPVGYGHYEIVDVWGKSISPVELQRKISLLKAADCR